MTRMAGDIEAQQRPPAASDVPELVAEVDELFRRVVRRLAGQPLIPLNLDLTMGQFRTLWVLSTDQPLSVGQLAQRLGVGQPSTSRMIDRLLQEGLVERWDDPTDRRRALVRLTPRGQETVAGAARPASDDRERLLELFARLDPAQIAQLQAGLRAVLDAAEREPEPPAP